MRLTFTMESTEKPLSRASPLPQRGFHPACQYFDLCSGSRSGGPSMTGLLTSIQAALGLPHTPIPFTSSGALPSAFAVTDLACASIAAAGQAVSELLQQHTGRLPTL